MPGRTIDGLYWPSVTEVIPAALRPDFSAVPRDVLAQAAHRGQALHRTVELFEHDDLGAVHPKISSGLEAWQRFKAETGFRFEAGEFEVRSNRWRYIGRPDARGWFGATRGLVDIKYVANFSRAYQEYTALQTIGGYAPAWDEEHPMEPIGCCYALWIRMDGNYRVVRLEKPNARMIFQAALVIHHEMLSLRRDNGRDADGGDAEA